MSSPLPAVRERGGHLFSPLPQSRERGELSTESDAVCFLVCWAVVYVGFFSLAQTKLPNYILPAYPPLALLTARFLDRWRVGAARPARWIMPLALGYLALVGVVSAVGQFVASGVVLPCIVRARAVARL